MEKSAQQPHKQTEVAVVKPSLSSVTVPVAPEQVHQDWDDGGDTMMDLSTNIQDILKGLSEDETMGDEKPDDNAKENQNGGAKLFPLFYKQPSTQP